MNKILAGAAGPNDSASAMGQEGRRATLQQRLSLLHRLATPLWLFDMDSLQIIWANQAGLELWSAATLDDLKTRDFSAMSATTRERLEQCRKEVKSASSASEELWTFYPKGKPATYRCILSGVVLDDGRIALLNEVIREVDDTPSTLRSIQALIHTSVAISLYDEECRFLYANPAAREMLVNESSHLRDRFVDPEDYQLLLVNLRRDGFAKMTVQVALGAGDAEARGGQLWRWHDIDARKSADSVTGLPAILVSETDVSDRQQAKEKAVHLAQHDALTGLPNRSYLQNWIEHRTQGDDKIQLKYCLLFIDLDRFKRINDSLGHEVGDALLIAAGKRLAGCIRASDIVVRLGGDEFVVVLEGTARATQAARVAENIHRSLAAPFMIRTYKLNITASIGVSVAPQHGSTLAEMLKNADLAMYEAKDSGRNQHVFFTSAMDENANYRLALETNLRRAFEQGELQVYYQPRLSLHDNKIVGAEALLRWPRANHGMISPAEFIPIAEEIGLMEVIGEWVMTSAAQQQKQWAEDGHELTVAVNLSAQQFHHHRLLDSIKQMLAKTICNPGSLELEITEAMLMGDSKHTLETLKTLHSMGFQLAIDDFGTGYSNFAYLRHYPISCLKIDRSFINSPENTAIAELIIEMCKLLDVRIVAEGIEHDHQIDWLRGLGCHEYQGYFFSPAIPAEQFAQLL